MRRLLVLGPVHVDLDLVPGGLLVAAGGGVGRLADVVDLALVPHLEIGQLRVDGGPDVAGQRPGRRRPDEEVFAGPAAQGELDEDRLVVDLLVAFLDLHLAQADAAARAPRHGVVAAVDEAAAVALLEEGPDRVVVLLGHREVRIPLSGRFGPVLVGAVPVHPVAEADRLLRLDAGEPVHALLAELHEAVDAGEDVAGHQVLDVALGGELQLLLDLDLDPQALAVEAVLVALALALHGVVALEGVLVSAAPGVVDAHRVVGGDGAVEEGPARAVLVLFAQGVEGPRLVPELEDAAFLCREIGLRVHFLERHDGPLAATVRHVYLIGRQAEAEEVPPAGERGV